MKQVEEGILLWEPSEERKTTAKINSYIKWLGEHKNMHFQDYHALWDWSVHEIEAFWASIWDYFDLQAEEGYQTILSSHHMPGAKWFPEATVNYTEHIFRNRATSNQPAIIHTSENRKIKTVSWRQLYQDTAAMQQVLKRLGIQKGDRVVAYLPNIYEAVVAFLATASVGAIWSSASPDFGTQSVIDRFQQIEPKLFFTIDGYVYGGKAFDRTDVAAEIQSSLPTLEATIAISYLEEQATFASLQHVIHWEQAIKEAPVRPLSFTYVAFNDPLWVLFSSGTTGKPKPIVQSQGGILLEHLKALTFHVDLGEGDRFFWFTTTGWMMWNFLIGGLLTGSTIILYDGNPAYPSKGRLWQLAEETKMTVFGTSASYITSCMKDNIKPYENYDLSQLKNISSTGSPLPPEGFLWCYENVKKDLWIASASGGTDVCTAFILGVPTLPVYAGELQCRGLGAKIESFNDNGKPVIEEVGELVLTEPFPSMPIYFWNDPDGSRLKESYFNVFPGIWRHGDYLKITKRKTCVIYGRSDATINRGGVRIGTSEIYRAVDHIPEIADSLIVDIPQPNSDSFVPLFVVMKDGCQLTDDLKQQINQHIRAHCSPRHVPTGIYEVPDLPRTLNGKKLEIPVKKILQGKQMEQIVNKGSLHNAAALDAFYQFAEKIKT
ncbi:acetoacetate--CoA ligase [Virgibacillus pantothenticus]|uniref:acetoacetate--CoA ligase n=1 Tax=Virgibacillus pantothenticus TaxID=1473 RepID=UPI001C24F197|nr:acetoacetate--CoA ligase [Virgibacillus pantothenticus]MBU8565229.1 acetoacetate--CoA ligase [Virgibacillus pantothenticus]MBU8601513.1 acetoacetate--CoA ligase [Virgibacillus pantothenticus]MBU8633548.1 acetoacetate--CoA ligase [Virgibacillus pantothenticus]MBU8643358.1 acetoacetate--CoA ligase [Virgibacillus pantothenticus]MBU8647588.1 acetoacetate--CoA ligase [Virgibacillus pantothenticus]